MQDTQRTAGREEAKRTSYRLYGEAHERDIVRIANFDGVLISFYKSLDAWNAAQEDYAKEQGIPDNDSRFATLSRNRFIPLGNIPMYNGQTVMYNRDTSLLILEYMGRKMPVRKLDREAVHYLIGHGTPIVEFGSIDSLVA
jgi:hypothetical protein